MNPSFDIFVSYSSDDASLVEGLVRLLQLSGRRVFVDKNSIEPGTLWENAFRQAITGSGQFVLLWCCHSSGSEWVAAEIQQAVAEAKPIIPLLLCGEPVPEPVSKYQWIDLRYLVDHPCEHAKSKADVKVIDARYLMPSSRAGGFTYLDTLYEPGEYLLSVSRDKAMLAEMRSMSPKLIAVCDIVFRALELQTKKPGYFRLF